MAFIFFLAMRNERQLMNQGNLIVQPESPMPQLAAYKDK
jgi:hypothetical protein